MNFDDEPGEEAAETEEEPAEDEEKDEAEVPPRPRTPILTIVLLILNFLAVPPFLILLVLDYSARQQWSYSTFMNRLYALGLPMQDEEDAAPAALYTRPRLRIDSDRIKSVYSNRPKAPGTPGFSEPFQPVDTVDESVDARVRPSQIGDQVKSDLFRSVGDPVGTLDEEVRRLKGKVPAILDEATNKFVADQANPQKKLAALEKLLLPLAWNTQQVEKLQAWIDKVKDNGPELDKLLAEAVQRRMLCDLMAPMNIYRPGDVTKFPIERIGERATDKDGKDLDEFEFKLDHLQDLLAKRFDHAIARQHIGEVHVGDPFNGKERDDIEKRHSIAFLMVALSQLKAPAQKEPLMPKLFERAQLVCGLYEFAQAAANYTRTLRFLEQRVLNYIEWDREGYVVRDKEGKVIGRTEFSFVERLPADIERIKKVKADIEFTRKRIKDLESQRDRYQKQFEERQELLTSETKKLIEARGTTKKLWDEAAALNAELFRSLVFLSEAGARNEALEAQIAQLERQLMNGGKKR
jgi:hypothetical protein